jgi:hypothetical protein
MASARQTKGTKPSSILTSSKAFTTFFLKIGSHNVAYANLKLMVLPPQLPECSDDRCAPPHPAAFIILYSSRKGEGGK